MLIITIYYTKMNINNVLKIRSMAELKNLSIYNLEIESMIKS